jgi:hypothetical protein
MISFTILLICLSLIKTISATPEIKNINIPSCRNCIHFNPNTITLDFTSSLNKCSKFGEKNIITNKINYDYVDRCREDEDKCGKLGKGWEEEPNIDLKIFKYQLLRYFPIFIVLYLNINYLHIFQYLKFYILLL